MPINIEEQKSKFICKVCGKGGADAIIHYRKYYPADKKETIEFPTLVHHRNCGETLISGRSGLFFDSPYPVEKTPECCRIMRGGDEGLVLLPIRRLTQMSVKQVAIKYLRLKGYERNELASPEWRKRVMRLRFLYLKPKEEEKDE